MAREINLLEQSSHVRMHAVEMGRACLAVRQEILATCVVFSLRAHSICPHVLIKRPDVRRSEDLIKVDM